MEKKGKSTDDLPPPVKLSETKFVFPDIWASIRIIFEKDIALLMLFTSMFIMAMYMILVPLQNIIRRQYDLSTTQVGLCYM